MSLLHRGHVATLLFNIEVPELILTVPSNLQRTWQNPDGDRRPRRTPAMSIASASEAAADAVVRAEEPPPRSSVPLPTY